MRLSCVCACVSGLLLVICLSAFCDPCATFKDCHTCTNQTGCLWMACANETAPACGNSSLRNASQCKTDCDASDTTAMTKASTQSPNTTANGTTPHTPSNTTVVTTSNTTIPAKTSAASASTTASPRTGSRFDAGSFIGGILLTLGMTAILFMGYKFSCAKREVQYRTIEEHDAII
ncbi:sialomucin core protein 24 [Polyodon spathula]|uniref:sialomucin core protein 24 n=1 Tax=Polyodon spathula TaxID=7913 RepID=UPI001B7F36EA|nr:sialomucin core protein 24 [Polyodon spathula]